MNILNRNLMLLAPKKPMYDWINKTFPDAEVISIPFNPFQSDYSTAYLIAELDGEEDFAKWIKKKYKPFFKEELSSWCSDTNMLPKNLTYELFTEWFHILYQEIVFDTVRNKAHIEEF